MSLDEGLFFGLPWLGEIAPKGSLGVEVRLKVRQCQLYEGWNFNSGNYLFTTDTK